jgi:hypothetical protein
MLLKLFFNTKHSVFDNILNKKLLNKNVYEKYFLRSNLLESKGIVVLDNDTSFFNVTEKNFATSYNVKFNSFEGCSMNIKKFLYKSKNFHFLRFQTLLFNFMNKNNYLLSFYESLANLNFEKTKNSIHNSLFFLKPIKGGFFCYSLGLIGFLPRRHGLLSMRRILFCLLSDNLLVNKISKLKFLLKKSHLFNTKYFILRLPFKIGKITIPFRSKRNNFSLAIKKKKKTFAYHLNFVFLIQKLESKKKL